MRITKLLSLDSAPAQAIIDRAKPITLTMTERISLPSAFTVEGATVENALGDVRPLEVGDILIDEKGGFYRIEAGAEDILKVTGDVALMQEAVYAFASRGLRVAQTEDGFAVVAIPQLKSLLENVGLTVTESHEPFTPIPLPRHAGGCCCGGHGHGGGCGCGGGGHGHDHDEEECGCGCGGHHHHHDDDGCCCGHDHDHESGECGCGGHHHHDEDGCCCGHDHDHEHGECGCGGHHPHDEEGCCCGHDHDHEHGECGCGGHHHHEEGGCCCGSKEK